MRWKLECNELKREQTLHEKNKGDECRILVPETLLIKGEKIRR